jgi:hypothetical protein
VLAPRLVPLLRRSSLFKGFRFQLRPDRSSGSVSLFPSSSPFFCFLLNYQRPKSKSNYPSFHEPSRHQGINRRRRLFIKNPNTNISFIRAMPSPTGPGENRIDGETINRNEIFFLSPLQSSQDPQTQLLFLRSTSIPFH